MKKSKKTSRRAQTAEQPQTAGPEQNSASEEDIKQSRRLWVGTVYRKIQAITGGRRLRLHVNIGGYAAYDQESLRNKWDHETGIDETTKELKKVHVEGAQIRVIIDKTNYHHLFRSSVCRDIIATIIERNETLHHAAQVRKNEARKAKKSQS